MIELASPGSAEVTLDLFDLAGRRVTPSLHRRIGAGREEFDVPLAHGLAPGVYLLRATDGRSAIQARIAVVR